MRRLDDKSAWAARAERMREMRLDGKVPKQIARDMGLDVWTVYRSLKASGAPASRVVPRKTRASIARMVASGTAQSAAARAHGVHPSTVCKWLKSGVI